MDQAALVEEDLRIGRDVIGLLAAANLAVSDAFWAYVPQAEEWRLVLSSPAVKTLGVQDSYSRMSNALHKSPLWEEIPLRRISLFAPDEDVIQRLRALEKYRYEGALEVIRNDGKNGRPTFLLFFVPYKGSGGGVPTVALDEKSKLEEFLCDQIGIDDLDLQTALRALESRGSYTFENLHLTTTKLRKVGLLHPLHPRTVYSPQ